MGLSSESISVSTVGELRNALNALFENGMPEDVPITIERGWEFCTLMKFWLTPQFIPDMYQDGGPDVTGDWVLVLNPEQEVVGKLTNKDKPIDAWGNCTQCNRVQPHIDTGEGYRCQECGEFNLIDSPLPVSTKD